MNTGADDDSRNTPTLAFKRSSAPPPPPPPPPRQPAPPPPRSQAAPPMRVARISSSSFLRLYYSQVPFSGMKHGFEASATAVSSLSPCGRGFIDRAQPLTPIVSHGAMRPLPPRG